MTDGSFTGIRRRPEPIAFAGIEQRHRAGPVHEDPRCPVGQQPEFRP
jgi:hypothetical protein